MELFDSPDPAKRVLIAGTYNAHPVNTAAAIATIAFLNNPMVYEEITTRSNQLYNGLLKIFSEKGIPAALTTNASAFCVYFCEQEPRDLHDILENHDLGFDNRYRQELIRQGIYFFPTPCKQGSVSYSHTAEDIDETLTKVREVLGKL
jgi:glutamate-1-semialdehyde 2,1-aminomutase